MNVCINYECSSSCSVGRVNVEVSLLSQPLIAIQQGICAAYSGVCVFSCINAIKVIKGHKRRTTPELVEGGASQLRVTMATVVPKEVVMWYHHTCIIYVDIYILPDMFVTL